MAGKGSGGGTSFEDMSHEEMLAWLDQANAGEVQAAADRLTAAAKEIRKIAEELKVRPQWVAWKGEGADAFRAWANDLANSTHALGDFSEGAAKWLGEASGAIARTQVSIPRDAKGAQANLDAANVAHNDPEAAPVRSKAAYDLAALKADKEKVRQEAAAEMRKLGQSYDLSATQMNTLQRPKFPPPPAVITPPDPLNSRSDLGTPESTVGTHGSGSAGPTSGATTVHAPSTSARNQGHLSTGSQPQDALHRSLAPHVPRPTAQPATHVGIDSVTAPPEAHQPSTVHTPSSAQVPVDTRVASPSVPLPVANGPVRIPSVVRGPSGPLAGGNGPGSLRQVPEVPAAGRGVVEANPPAGRVRSEPFGAIGRSAVNPGPTAGPRGSSASGITGGRPTAPAATNGSAGRTAGPPVGNAPAPGRGPVSRTPITGVARQSANEGAVTGRTGITPRDGISGGTPQRVARPAARPGASVPNAPTRGGISGGLPSQAGGRSGDQRSPGGVANRVQQRNETQKARRRTETPTSD